MAAADIGFSLKLFIWHLLRDDRSQGWQLSPANADPSVGWKAEQGNSLNSLSPFLLEEVHLWGKQGQGLEALPLIIPEERAGEV